MPRRKRNSEDEAPKRGRAPKDREIEDQEEIEDEEGSENLPAVTPGVDLYLSEDMELVEDPEEYQRVMESTRAPVGGLDDPRNLLIRTTKWQGNYFLRFLPMVTPKGSTKQPRELFRPIARHWNLFPPDEDQGYAEPVGCPNVNHNTGCPICHILDEAIRRRIRSSDKIKKDGFFSQRRYLARVLFYGFEASPTEPNTPPAWDTLDLPVIKVVEMATMARNWIDNKVKKSADLSNRIFHTKKGRVVILTKLKDKPYYDFEIEDDSDPIDEEFLDFKRWPNLEAFVPTHTAEEILERLEENQADLPDWFRNAWQSCDVDYAALDVPSREIE
jgi:hypothetical protein